ncbi:hypothetical protein ABES80_12330 [Bacillus gobiensis]|uniref:hypothetical protein n=1 Tax=Bacillus gobiensis TaxID=1441095 RepID=UPI003D196209
MDEKKETIGIRARGEKNGFIGDNVLTGFTIGIDAENNDNTPIVGNTIRDLPEADFMNLKAEILKEIATTLEEVKTGKSNSKVNHLIQFASSFGSTALVELLKSYGIIPPAPNG